MLPIGTAERREIRESLETEVRRLLGQGSGWRSMAAMFQIGKPAQTDQAKAIRFIVANQAALAELIREAHQPNEKSPDRTSDRGFFPGKHA